MTGTDAEKLISRAREIDDGAIPSGNSVAALSLLRMGRLTMDRELENQAQATLNAFSSQLAKYPAGYCQMMIALDFTVGPTREIVIAGDESDPKVQAFLREIDSHFLPNQVTIFRPLSGEAREKIESLSPFTKNQTALGGQATVYVCRNYVCDLPTNEIEKLKNLLVQ